jgi:hypothetical protein
MEVFVLLIIDKKTNKILDKYIFDKVRHFKEYERYYIYYALFTFMRYIIVVPPF